MSGLHHFVLTSFFVEMLTTIEVDFCICVFNAKSMLALMNPVAVAASVSDVDESIFVCVMKNNKYDILLNDILE